MEMVAQFVKSGAYIFEELVFSMQPLLSLVKQLNDLDLDQMSDRSTMQKLRSTEDPAEIQT